MECPSILFLLRRRTNVESAHTVKLISPRERGGPSEFETSLVFARRNVLYDNVVSHLVWGGDA
jgi:hypothetical protein